MAVAVAAVLVLGGQFVFETRNLACALWNNWVPERSEIALAAPDGVPVCLWYQLVERQGDYVAFDRSYAFEGSAALIVLLSCLWFSTVNPIETLATAAG